MEIKTLTPPLSNSYQGYASRPETRPASRSPCSMRQSSLSFSRMLLRRVSSSSLTGWVRFWCAFSSLTPDGTNAWERFLRSDGWGNLMQFLGKETSDHESPSLCAVQTTPWKKGGMDCSENAIVVSASSHHGCELQPDPLHCHEKDQEKAE